MSNIRYYVLFSLLSIWFCAVFPIASYDALPKAVVVVPIADVVHFSLQELVPADQLYQAYQSLCYKEAGEESTFERAYQLLFNEEVGVVACRGDEVLVYIPHIYYQEGRGAIPQRYYWMLKDAIRYIDELQEVCTDCGQLPPPIKSSYHDLEECNKNIVTLAMPYRHPKIDIVYSAGTRFVRANTQDDSVVHVYALNSNTLLYDILELPRSTCIMYERKSKTERVDEYIALIRRWIKSQTNGVIPYVWGGSSFTHHVKENESWHPYHKRRVHLAHTFDSYPYAGFDCSCLIWRAALMSGIPYFFTNSRVMKENMRSRIYGEKIENGDILWFEGHVMIASSIQENMVIEARGYGAGYGRLHEIPLNEMFADIATYEDLEQLCFNHKPVTLLHRDGSVRLVIDDFKVLPFQEGW